MGTSAAALALAVTAGVSSVEGFVSPPPVGGARSAFLRTGAINARVVSSLADCSMRAKTTPRMSLKPSNADANRSRRLLRWARPGSGREGVLRRVSLPRRAAERDEDGNEEDEEYEYEDGEIEEYGDDDQGLDRWAFTRAYLGQLCTYDTVKLRLTEALHMYLCHGTCCT